MKLVSKKEFWVFQLTMKKISTVIWRDLKNKKVFKFKPILSVTSTPRSLDPKLSSITFNEFPVQDSSAFAT